MAQLKISRPKQFLTYSPNFKIFIDGELACELGAGETKSFDLSPGLHRVQGKLLWTSSSEVDIQIMEKRDTVLSLDRFQGGTYLISINHILAAMSIAFLRHPALPYILSPALLILVFRLCFMTLGKNRYLRIQEVNLK